MRAAEDRRSTGRGRIGVIATLGLVAALVAGITPRWATAQTTPDGRCAGQRPTVVGTAGNDSIVGTPGSDVILALGGSDRISGGGGYDVICAGDGNDTVQGDAGPDVVYGEAGSDILEGGADSNVLYGGPGYDKLSGGDANDVLDGEVGTDVLYGEGGNDQLYGGGESDAVFGGAGNDFARGEAGDDVLYGEAGNDRLDGEAGDDQLYGGAGHDQLHGRQGRDVLLGDVGNDFLDGGPDADECNAGVGNDTVVNCETGPYTAPGAGQACAGPVTERLRLPGGDRGYPSPYGHRIGPGLTQANYLFDTLVWKDATGEFIPWLAEEYQASPGRTEWRFLLREGVTWQDGRPLTADDVVFTHQYMTRHEASLRAIGLITLQGLEAVREVVAESPRVVVFRLHRPYAPFLDWIGGRMLITPRHVWENVADPANYRGPGSLMGSGPYRLETYDPAGRGGAEQNIFYRFVANDAYFVCIPRVRALDYVRAGNPLQALQQGQVDQASVGENVPNSALTPFQQNAATFGSITAPGENTTGLHFNLARGFPFNDVRFRRAVAYALDRREMLQSLYFGRGELGSYGLMAPSHPSTPPDLPTYERNLAQANALLDQVGLFDCNGDRVRDLPRSDATQPCQPFVPELLTAGSAPPPPGPEPQPTPPPTILSLVTRYLNEVSIQVRPRFAGDEHLSESIRGNFEMNLIGYGALGGDADWVRIRLSSRFPALSHARIPGYDNPVFEELAARQQVTPVAEAGEGTEEDPAPREGDPRRQVIEEMLRVVAADVPGISLVVPNRLMFFDKRVFNAWYFTPGGVWGAYPRPENKHAFITGRTIGFRASPPPYEPPPSPTPSPG